MSMLMGAFLLTLLEAAALWLLGVFDRPKFVWDDSFLAGEELWEEDEAVDDDEDDENDERVGNNSRKESPQEKSSSSSSSPDEVYVLMAVCKSKRVSHRLVCPMLNRTRRAILEATTTTTTTAPSESEPRSTNLQDLMAQGATTYGAPPDTRYVAMGLYFMHEPSSSQSSKSNRRCWWRSSSSSSCKLEQEEWGFGWLLGAATSMKQLQAMKMAASQVAPELFVPSCTNDSPSLVFDMKAFRIQVPGPVVKGRIACRSFLSPYVARWLHWRRAQALFDDQQQQQGETETESLSPCNRNNSSGANDNDISSNKNNNNKIAASISRPCVRCEMYMVGTGHAFQCIDYILIGADRVHEVVMTAEQQQQQQKTSIKTKLA